MAAFLDKTLEQLDGQDWGEPPYGSHLVTTCYRLRKKPLRDFCIEDLRILIGQNIRLDILIPLALETLRENILAEGDFFPGNLLKNILTSDTAYWKKHTDQWTSVKQLYEIHSQLFEQDNTYRQVRKSFEQLEKLNDS